MTARAATGHPTPGDFAPPPSAVERRRWIEADAAARPARLARLRSRFADAGIDAYFGASREHMRYLTGFALADTEVKVAGHSGQFLVSSDEVVLVADTRYTVQARREAPEVRLAEVTGPLPAAWEQLVRSAGAKRVGVEAGHVSHALWERLQVAAPDVELVSVEGWLEADRAVKEPAELERVAAACAVADRALASILPAIRPGRTEREIALELEWAMRTGGADGLAFDVACLGGSQAALPHGSPRDERVEPGRVLLFDFGAEVAGYRSDMTRTLFVGDPVARDLDVHELVVRAQAAAIERIESGVAGGESPRTRELDAVARGVIEHDGRWPAYGHGTGHGIGLATHERPSLSRTGIDEPLPSPTVFSVEPGVYLEGEMGVRIEDLVAFDLPAGRVERLTLFPRDVLVVGA